MRPELLSYDTVGIEVFCLRLHCRLIADCGFNTMLPQRIKKTITDNPKKLANLIDLVNLPSTLREFVGQSQISRLGCFKFVWSYIKTNNLQDSNDKNVVNCDDKLRNILLGKRQVELAELPALIKTHFPKEPK
ncbi:Upstream activation factor subunit like [Quillaja saponaria]|uniref:Upstream activation factor subunit like n=2 Tax=Quillaja saponaria TaxID=32244 RepID=A0AAD7LMW1_QUISA|nr:Upstream activation factor subunit like [Quillaja saponaria]